MTDKWKETLSDEAYRVTRQAGTERPFSGVLLDETRDGNYVCKCCGAILFSAETKFDTGCGWPSFYDQAKDSNVGFKQDTSHGMVRTEIFCKQCEAHLGHVFPDGPEPTGQRYCVNSLSMDFNSDTGDTVEG
ncbi:peptide-methionine (R)-S-oxide reductase MsrB [Alteromonas lipotrueiana]|uniref:peptide-methionine (R)-S-oxide reductase MsrB n=1 Tax=Alteromonas lipotrueiana TaxID=2803815 RepID=UPI001C47E155|nr:peptide-methionine (R)-S-oxide reductase MsrB [Alteromonas lipotrueiana]